LGRLEFRPLGGPRCAEDGDHLCDKTEFAAVAALAPQRLWTGCDGVQAHSQIAVGQDFDEGNAVEGPETSL
jgi:hypothetical protein